MKKSKKPDSEADAIRAEIVALFEKLDAIDKRDPIGCENGPQCCVRQRGSEIAELMATKYGWECN